MKIAGTLAAGVVRISGAGHHPRKRPGYGNSVHVCIWGSLCVLSMPLLELLHCKVHDKSGPSRSPIAGSGSSLRCLTPGTHNPNKVLG